MSVEFAKNIGRKTALSVLAGMVAVAVCLPSGTEAAKGSKVVQRAVGGKGNAEAHAKNNERNSDKQEIAANKKSKDAKKKIADEKPSSPLLKIGGLKNGKRVVKTVAVEEYLRGVLPEEMSPEWAEGALKAQAVAARTFALKNRGRHAAEGFDLCDTTHCQIYDENEKAASTDKAIKDTVGEVLMNQGQLIEAVFHTDSGGMTEDSENVWGGVVPYLRAVKEEQIETKPWTKVISPQDFAKAVGIEKPKRIKLSPLKLGVASLDRSVSGRVKTITVEGDDSKKIIGGTDFRKMFDLPSTLFSVRTDGKSIIVSGFGSGHGLGLSQWGAKYLADNGADYRTILAHYYKDTTTAKIY